MSSSKKATVKSEITSKKVSAKKDKTITTKNINPNKGKKDSKNIVHDDIYSTNEKIKFVNQFFIDELIHWYLNHNNLLFNSYSYNKDITIIDCVREEFHGDLLTLIKQKTPFKEEINFGNNHKAIFYAPIKIIDFTKTELISEKDLKRKSYQHHHILSRMLYELKENMQYFESRLYQYTIQKLPNADSISNDKKREIMLKRFSDFLADIIHKKKRFIPELKTYNSQTNIMSSRDVNDYFEIENDPEYTYRFIFSLQTSLDFTIGLKDIIDKWIDMYKPLIFNHEDFKPKYKQGNYSLPDKALERLDFITNFYKKISKIPNENLLEFNKGQIMYLFKLLEKHKILPKNKSKESIILGISLLTGISAKKLYDLYPTSGDIDYDKLFDDVHHSTYKKQLNAIINKLKDISNSEHLKISGNSNIY